MFRTLIDIAAKAAGIYHERQRLAGLTDRQLHDIGVSRDEAAREAKRPVWDAPERWQQKPRIGLFASAVQSVK